MHFFPDRIELAPGETATIEVDVVRHGYCGPIEVAVDGLPETVQSDPASVSWPATIATVQLQAADVLLDEIRSIRVRAHASVDLWESMDLRTRAAAEPDWNDEVVGIPHTRMMVDPVWLDENRILFSDFERIRPEEVTPVVHCIDPGVGRCPGFGYGGSVSLEPRTSPHTRLARAPDGTTIVATGDWEPMRTTSWGRLTRAGDWIPLPGIVSAATDTATGDVAVDSKGRILFLSQPDGWSTTKSLVRLNPDGSLDTSFGEAGSVLAVGFNRIHLVPDGRIVLDRGDLFEWLQEDGSQIGPPVTLDYWANPAEALPDGSIIYGQMTNPDSPYEMGTVTIVDSAGNLVQSWALGLLVEPRALLLDGGDPLVVAQVDRSGLLRVMRLPFDAEPVTVAEGTVGDDVSSAWAVRSGSLFVLGDRPFRLPDGAVSWEEAFVWRAN